MRKGPYAAQPVHGAAPGHGSPELNVQAGLRVPIEANVKARILATMGNMDAAVSGNTGTNNVFLLFLLASLNIWMLISAQSLPTLDNSFQQNVFFHSIWLVSSSYYCGTDW